MLRIAAGARRFFAGGSIQLGTANRALDRHSVAARALSNRRRLW
jgi:hypothetical protein